MSPDWSFVVILNTPIHVQVFTITSVLFAHSCIQSCTIVWQCKPDKHGEEIMNHIFPL